MADVHVKYHYEGDDGWWIDSPDYPTYVAFGKARAEVTALAAEGLRLLSEDDPELNIVGLDMTLPMTTTVRCADPVFPLVGLLRHVGVVHNKTTIENDEVVA